MSNFAFPRTTSPNRRPALRPPSRQGTINTLRRPSSTISLRRPSTPLNNQRSNMSSTSSPSSSRPNSSMSNRSARPGSSLSRLGNRVNSLNENVYNGTITVSIRPRPLNERTKTTWMVDSEENSIYGPDIGDFNFDNVFNPLVNNKNIYENSMIEIVNKVLQGFNGTVFAYGITGSGKTHSMQGSMNDPGIIPLAANDIFSFVKENQHIKQYNIKVSYLEIYNEKIFDLLAPETNSPTMPTFTNNNNPISNDLKIRDDPIIGVKVIGLSEVEVHNVEELLSLIDKGHSSRKTSETEYNSRSSRSHAVVLIRINSIDLLTKEENVATLSLCDLAGSERASNQTTRRKEGAYINKSLLALSTAISKLSVASTSKTSNAGHIPFRDSKLTRLLQPSLSGNAVISILCTVHLGEQAYSETVSTLRFAAKAKNITVNVSKHDLLGNGNGEKDRIIDKLQNVIQKQKLEIELLKTSNELNNLSINSNNNSINNNINNNSINDLKFAQLQAENRILTERVEHLTRLTDEKRTENVILKTDIMNLLTTSSLLLNNPILIQNLEELFRQQSSQIEEFGSYISHLENELGKYEVKKYFQNDHKPLSPISDSLTNSLSGLISPTKVRNNVLQNGSQKDLQSLIETQKEEIEELNEVIKDKDKIIKALRTTKKFKNSLVQGFE